MHPYYRIAPKEQDFGYVLFNEASGAICGDRLRKGGNFPFTEKRWMEYEDLNQAELAAAKLQRYLEARETGKK